MSSDEDIDEFLEQLDSDDEQDEHSDILDGSDSLEDLEESYEISDIEELETLQLPNMEQPAEETSAVDDCVLKASLKELIQLSCLRYGMPTYKFQHFVWKRHKVFTTRRCTPEDDKRNQSIPLARSGHRMVFHNGRLYAFGGYNPNLPEGRQLFREMWEYNIATRRWKLVQMHGSVPQNLASHTACIVDDNDSATSRSAKMLVYGGTGTPFGINMSRGAFLCDLHGGFRWSRLKVRAVQDARVTDGTLEEVTFSDDEEENLDSNDNHPHLPKPLYGQAIALVNNKESGPQLYTIGGTSGFEYFIDVDRLVFRHRRWEACYRSQHDHTRLSGREPLPRYRHELAVRNGKIYLFGGGTSDMVHDLTEVWTFDTNITSKPIHSAWPAHNNHSEHRAANSISAQMGRGAWIKKKTIRDPAVALIDGVEDQYPPPRRCHGVAQRGQYAYIFGGYDGTNIFGDIWRLDLDTLAWKRLPKDMAEPVYFHGASITPNGQLFTFGGVQSIDTNERSDKIHSIWLNIPSLRDMAWQAILHYLPDIATVGFETMREAGIPIDLLESIHDEPSSQQHPNKPDVG